MTLETEVAAVERLDLKKVERLVRRKGPFWTVLLPATHPWSGEGDKLLALHSMARQLGVKADAQWVYRVERLLVERELAGGGPGLMFVLGDGVEEVLATDLSVAEVIDGPYPYVLPVLREIETPQEFLILGISKNLLRLIDYRHGSCREMELPEAMVKSLKEFHGDEKRDGYPERKLAAGVEELERYFAQVDAGLAGSCEGKVLLMGLSEELAAFRRASKHLKFFDAEIGVGMKDLSLGEIAQLGGACAQTEQRFCGQRSLEKIREHLDRSKVEEDPRRLEVEARNGQVELLCVRLPEGQGGLVSELNQVLNAAAVETLRHGGHVCALAASEMKEFGEAVGLLRYL